MAETKKQNAKIDERRRMVTIKLFRDNNRYKEPLVVGLNDYSAQIQRGVAVQVPYFVAKHIEEMNAQDEATAMMIEAKVNEYAQQNK